jgi:hypothetical protein
VQKCLPPKESKGREKKKEEEEEEEEEEEGKEGEKTYFDKTLLKDMHRNP